LGAILLLGIAASGVNYFSNRAENKAFAMLGRCVAKYETMLEEVGPEKACLGVEKDFQQIMEEYSNKDGGKIASVMFADIYYNAGDYDKAIKLYNKALDGFDGDAFVKNRILTGIGYAFEGKKDYETAAKYFAEIASKPDSIMKDEALFNLGRMYEAIGNHDKSINAFKKIISEHPNSMYIDVVKERISG
jgi:tetratricopeptide (TPR) repeat protein